MGAEPNFKLNFGQKETLKMNSSCDYDQSNSWGDRGPPNITKIFSQVEFEHDSKVEEIELKPVVFG
jgi:hypothetical protein